jgi:hypothetical protein
LGRKSREIIRAKVDDVMADLLKLMQMNGLHIISIG